MVKETPEELAFRSWLTARGAVVSPAVGLKQFAAMGRGAVALEDIQVSRSHSVEQRRDWQKGSGSGGWLVWLWLCLCIGGEGSA